jgi:hypothetical protein
MKAMQFGVINEWRVILNLCHETEVKNRLNQGYPETAGF